MGAQLWLGGETALSGISIYAPTVQPTNAEKSFDRHENKKICDTRIILNLNTITAGYKAINCKITWYYYNATFDNDNKGIVIRWRIVNGCSFYDAGMIG